MSIFRVQATVLIDSKQALTLASHFQFVQTDTEYLMEIYRHE